MYQHIILRLYQKGDNITFDTASYLYNTYNNFCNWIRFIKQSMVKTYPR